MYTLYSSVYATLPVTGDVKMVDVWLIHGLLNPFVVFMVLIASQMLTCKYDADIKQNKIDEGKAQTLGKWNIDSPKKIGVKGIKFQSACKFLMPVATAGFVLIFFIAALNNPQRN